jgi:acetyl esterase
MLDPQIAQMLQAMQANNEPPLFKDATADEARRRGIHVRAQYYPPVLMDVARVDERTIPGPAAAIPVRVYWPEKPTGATIAFFHGGGWIIGDLDSHDGHARRLAATVGAVVVHVDYRLAPEHPFPAAYEDCIAAITWVHEHVDELGGRADRIAVAGDSAGGNLAAAVAVACRDAHLPLAAQLLVYPAVDLTAGLTAAGDEPAEGDFNIGQDDWVERQYLADDLRRATDPRVSPLHAESHAGLAPAVIGIGHHDPLLAQDLAYAAALRAAGVPVVLREYPDLIHGFFGMGAVSACAEHAADQLSRDLRALLVGEGRTDAPDLRHAVTAS